VGSVGNGTVNTDTVNGGEREVDMRGLRSGSGSEVRWIPGKSFCLSAYLPLSLAFLSLEIETEFEIEFEIPLPHTQHPHSPPNSQRNQITFPLLPYLHPYSRTRRSER
jgi:hypothetical protein